jgi:hypothetical protein
MNKRQWIALWIMFFLFSLLVAIYVIKINDAQFYIFLAQYRQLPIPSQPGSNNDLWDANYQFMGLKNLLAVGTFLSLNFCVLILVLLRKKERL